MKRLLSLIVLAGIILVSCAKEQIVSNKAIQEQPSKGWHEVTLNANTGVEMTKTAYTNDDKEFSWSVGDQISVLFNDGTNNKFFTFTIDAAGDISGSHNQNATFHGSVEDGFDYYGATAAEGGAKWALYPANSNHSWNTTTHMPDFYMPAEIDFTASHFSANIPLWAKGDGENNYSFNYTLTGCYKFEFSGLTSVNKVRFQVHSNGSGGYYLSGKSPIKASEYDTYLDCYNGKGSRDVAYIANVDPVSHKVVFYVPFRSWESMTPNFTLINYDEGSNKWNTLLSATGKKALNAASLNTITVVPEKAITSGTGTPYVFSSGLAIDWAGAVEGTGSTGADNKGILSVKAKADASYLYLYLAIDSYYLLQFGGDGQNLLRIYLGNEGSTETASGWTTKYTTYVDALWLTLNGAPTTVNPGNLASFTRSSANGNGVYYYELKIDRSTESVAWLDDTISKITVGVRVMHHYYAWGGSSTPYMYAPAGGSMLTINL